jgi:hypothetical protein
LNFEIRSVRKSGFFSCNQAGDEESFLYLNKFERVENKRCPVPLIGVIVEPPIEPAGQGLQEDVS